MTIQYYGYPKCTTCLKALKWLKGNNLAFEQNHIVENPPSKELLREMLEKSELDIKKFFNTSGMKYRELQLKDKLSQMSIEEQLELLASEGMLIKRPIVYNGKQLTLGYKEAEFEQTWKIQ
ncbi:arsenate reductase [Psychrobacillus insolitus]|uniref:Arsenate reductase n=1 Tax=Psychrobacillus insolitus TaxID=1461 RepID=A0A2W7MFV6_9BACI|nr:arsenate reductase family protein [Psychrobacillus insolitus]PZX04808.1 arsenate reductase [Psychrobacillus insolitus]